MEIFIICSWILALFCLFEPIMINFVYFFNIGLFLDLILLKKKKDKLIKYILLNYKYDEVFDIVERIDKDV